MNKMSELSKIDKNFEVKTKINKDNIKFYSCTDEPFKIYGLLKPDAKYDFFKRMSIDVAEKVNVGVHTLATNTAGGRIRFKTNSAYVAVNAVMHNIQIGEHFPLTGTAGFDLYEIKNGKEFFVKTYIPPLDIKDRGGYEGIIEFSDKKERELTINFPLYSGVKALYIGVEEAAYLKSASEYKTVLPIVYYGSSITQGGCASRPGNAYQAMISRRLGCDYVNLGFSGSAKAEKEMAEYIAELDMSGFVYDYDYNADDVEYLKKTHRQMFEIIRKKNPDLPIVIVSKPDFLGSEDTDRRFEIIENTYIEAKYNGDKNVYLIDGRNIMSKIADDSGTVDSVHPNDLGFYCMARMIGDTLEKILR